MEAKGAAGWDASAAAWIARVDGGDPSRELLLDPVMLDLCGDVNAAQVLDIGCGEGRFSRMLAARGAAVTGVEPCVPLIRAARRRDPRGAYVEASAEVLPFASASFDLAVLYLVLIDVADYRAAIGEAARVLRPCGRLVVANILSFRSALDTGWITDDEGRRRYVPVDDYFAEHAAHVEWCGISVTNYHRPAECYFSAFLDAGLRLVAYREPAPTQELVRRHPAFEGESRVPFFNAMAWRRD